jgi:hypothetical protein
MFLGFPYLLQSGMVLDVAGPCCRLGELPLLPVPDGLEPGVGLPAKQQHKPHGQASMHNFMSRRLCTVRLPVPDGLEPGGGLPAQPQHNHYGRHQHTCLCNNMSSVVLPVPDNREPGVGLPAQPQHNHKDKHKAYMIVLEHV